MQMTIFNTPIVTPVARCAAWLFLKWTGWKKDGDAPSAPKCVMICAPHTSNWDAPFMLALAFALRAQVYFMLKNTYFRWPYGWFFRWLGAIPVDRSKANGMVGQTIDIFNQNEHLIIGVPPEGTRKKVGAWKTGFYYIAVGAKVPIALGFLDYKKKQGGCGPLFYPTGDIQADMRHIREFYADITAKYPELTSLPEIPESK